jgi:hypothetical protein
MMLKKQKNATVVDSQTETLALNDVVLNAYEEKRKSFVKCVLVII